VTFLLDVNLLIALAYEGHAEHPRASAWYASLPKKDVILATCSICELGFVRVSFQAGLEASIPEAVETLTGLVASSRLPFERLSDDLGAADLPPSVRGPKQITDGHLLVLARKHGAQLATLDRAIPGAVIV
jgi:predicted nucleic acid-binding protein